MNTANGVQVLVWAIKTKQKNNLPLGSLTILTWVDAPPNGDTVFDRHKLAVRMWP